MKLTFKRKRKVLRGKLERLKCRRAVEHFWQRHPDSWRSLDDLFLAETARTRKRIEREVRGFLREQKIRARLGILSALNYLLRVSLSSDLPEAGGMMGKWLEIHPAARPGDTDRTVSLVAGGPLAPTKTNGRFSEIDAWFCSAQEIFGGRPPWNVIGEDGLQGARAVAAALDAMNPEGPPQRVKKGRT